jgi:hypothetical protein
MLRIALREPPLNTLGAVSTVEPQGPESRRAGIEGRIETASTPGGDQEQKSL